MPKDKRLLEDMFSNTTVQLVETRRVLKKKTEKYQSIKTKTQRKKYKKIERY